MADHAREKNESPDRVPQGSIPQVLAEAERLLKDITPDDRHVKRISYDHGGGRMFRGVPRGNGQVWHDDEDRTLIIDAYQEGDREFYFNAARLVRELLTALRSLPPVPMQEVLAELIAKWRDVAGECDASDAAMWRQRHATFHRCALDLEVALRSLASPQHEKCPKCGEWMQCAAGCDD